MRVVICDGHRVFADALASLLRSAGHHVAGTALDLDEAVGMLGAGQDAADACVIDLRLPRSGLRPDIGRAVAAAPGTAFVALTGSADPSLLRHAMAAGVRGVALKGDDFGEFLRVLTESVAGHGPAAWEAGPPAAGPVILSASARAAVRRGDGAQAGPSQFLTEREREALGRLVRGESTAGMARAMGVRVSTARTHIDAVLGKLGAHTRLEAIAYAVREGLVDVNGWQAEQPAVGT
jgi:two-component system, NarL family, nitrate/nitrite response regulator NarL